METTAAAVSSSDGPASTSASSALSRWKFALSQRHRHLLDKLVPHVLRRWIAFFVLAFVYFLRVYLAEGFHVVTYALGMFMLTLFIEFLRPKADPERQELMDGPTLPIRGSDEFRPFVRRLPEFKFWWVLFLLKEVVMYCFSIGLVLTFFPLFDVAVCWPILLLNWMLMFFVSVRKQIMRMIKYKYLPLSFGKRRYGKRSSTDTTENLPKD